MKLQKRSIILGVLVLSVLIIASGITPLYVSTNARYKMTVNVETPEGLKTGYAVREISNGYSVIIDAIRLPEMTNPAKVKGEAVVVDLGERGKVFALLRGMARLNEIYGDGVVYYNLGGGTGVEGIQELNRLPKNKPYTLSVDYYPILVMFKDINEPNSVVPLLETEYDGGENGSHKYLVTEDRVQELLGQGVRIKDITIEMTNEPITWGIENDLPWLPSRKEMRGTFPPGPKDPGAPRSRFHFKGNEFSKGRFW